MKSILSTAVVLATIGAALAEPLASNETYCAALPAMKAAKAVSADALERIDTAAAACQLSVEMTATEAEKLLAGKTAALSVSGDDATFLARSPAKGVIVSGSLHAAMTRIAATDLWVARFRLANTAEAMLKYFPEDQPATPLTNVVSIDWRGPKAPPLPETKSKIAGVILKRTLYSGALQETRRVEIYLPPGYRDGGAYPALYMADGDNVEWWAPMIESLIDRGVISPVVIVGAVSGQVGIVEDRSSLNTELRAADYLPDYPGAGDRFMRHMRFFTQELVPWAEQEFALARTREMRAVYGVSNGAVFAGHAAFNHPEIFGTALAFSAGWTPITGAGKLGAPRARFLLSAGHYETGFIMSTRHTERALKANGFDVNAEYLYAGHDPNMWTIMLAKYLPTVFKVGASRR